jgi:DNA-binding transcriptional regulator YiaG
MTIADEVRALRAALDEDTATFGQRWHKSGRTIENWEQGRREPDAFVLEAMRALAVKASTKRMLKKHGGALAKLAKG